MLKQSNFATLQGSRHISQSFLLSQTPSRLVLSAFLPPPASLCLFFGWTPDELVLRAHGSTKAPERAADGKRKKKKEKTTGVEEIREIPNILFDHAVTKSRGRFGCGIF